MDLSEFNEMKKIMILNGSPGKNGKTASLIRAFAAGASEAGNEVEEYYLYGLNINDCVGCEACVRRGATDIANPCAQKDDMVQIYEAFRKADVIVFASPIYYWTVTGKLKAVVDRLLAMNMALGMGGYRRSSVLLSTAAGNNYTLATE